MRISRRRFLCTGAALAACGKQPSFATIRASIQDLVQRGQVPSVAVGAAWRGTILWEEGFGWADADRKLAATADTVYSVASLTKPFTATGLMGLAQAGKIDLDAPVNDYLGSTQVKAMVGNARDATVRRVANHTSGLPLHVHFFYQNEPGEPPPIDETIRRYGLLVTQPGESWQYSNLGYGILGHVLERVSGQSYPAFMESAVLQPLGLRSTSVGETRIPGAVYAQRDDARGMPVADYTTDHVGASELWASVHDLLLFGMFHSRAHLSGQQVTLTDETIESMQTSGAGPAAHYGVGWNIGEAKGYKVVSHGGDMEGVTSLLLMLPSEQLVVAAICNRRSDVPGPIVDDIIEELLPGWKDDKVSPPPPSTPALPEELQEVWNGQLVSYSGSQPFFLCNSAGVPTYVKLGSQDETLVHNLTFDGSSLNGVLTDSSTRRMRENTRITWLLPSGPGVDCWTVRPRHSLNLRRDGWATR